MIDRRAFIYGQMADSFERDPIGPDGSGRAVVVNGRGFRWQRFNSAESLVWVETIDGRMVGLTPWQLKVYQAAKATVDNGSTSMRALAKTLGCAPSTVSRALVKLMAWGLLGYMTKLGRYSGTIVFTMHKGDGLDRLRRLARDKVKRWKEATDRRVSRLWANVAPYILEGEGVPVTYWDTYSNTPIRKGATLKAWTAEEVQDIRNAGII